MNVLVTGGAGYIGSHTCKALFQEGHTPVVYDNLARGRASAVKWGPLVVGDIADQQRVVRTIRERAIDAVMHFAAYAYVGESMDKPGLYFDNNVVGTLRLLEAMRETGVERIVFSSTCAVYGIPTRLPITEEHPQSPVNPYGESKLMTERVLRWYSEAYGISHLALRYFNAAGADPDGEIGECHEPETHLIPLVIEAALDHRHPIYIFGTDYGTPDGTAIRDYVHVSDLARAHVLAIERVGSGCRSETLNLGVGRGSSVRDVIEMVRQVTGLRPAAEETRRRAGDPASLVASAERARVVLGWSPERSTLLEMVSSAWNWRCSREYELAEVGA